MGTVGETSKGKGAGALPMGPIGCFAVVFAATVLSNASAPQESPSTDKPITRGVKFAENGRRY